MRSLIVCIVLLFSTQLQAQKTFPEQCIGVWEGTMYIYGGGLLRDSVRVRHTVKPIDKTSWTWKTDYLSEKLPMTKDYILRQQEPSIYLVDEGQNVTIPMRQAANKLYSVFEVQGILLTSSYELNNGQLIFEVISGKKNSEANAQVGTYLMNAVQRVELKRVK
jgi:hypothetical protein